MIATYILLASGLVSTTYGFGEKNCGDVGKARPCSIGAVTASGHNFDPQYPMAAVAAPAGVRVPAQFIGLKVKNGPCIKVLLADKMNSRYVGVRGFDLTPRTVELLTGKPARANWSDRVFLCKPKDLSWQPTSLNVSRSLQPLVLVSSRAKLPPKRRPNVKPGLRSSKRAGI